MGGGGIWEISGRGSAYSQLYEGRPEGTREENRVDKTRDEIDEMRWVHLLTRGDHGEGEERRRSERRLVSTRNERN